MASDISINISPQDKAKFDLALKAIANLFHKNIFDLLKMTAIFAVQSARKLTPISKRKREARRSTKEERSATKGRRYMMEWWTKTGEKEWRPINNLESTKREIKKRGAAKASWAGVLKKLGKNADEANSSLRRVMSVGSIVMADNSKAKAIIDITNRMAYIAKLVPNIEEDSMLLAEKRVLGNYMRQLGDNAELIWSNK